MNAQPLIVTAAIARRENRILLTQRPAGKRDAGLWEFPGGKLHGDETPEEGLQRELREELGVEAQVDGIFAVHSHRYDWGAVLLLFYNVRLQGEPQNLEVADHAWVALTDLHRYPLLPADQPILQQLLKPMKTRLPLLF